jgi:hypothetical protein
MSGEVISFFSDVAAIFLENVQTPSFGSGRLIAPGIVLTASHVVDVPTKNASILTGWKVRLIGDRDSQGHWDNDPYAAEVIWRHPGNADLALLKINNFRRAPANRIVFSAYDLVGELKDVVGVGLPKARWNSSDKSAREYSVHGTLRVAVQNGPYAWTVAYGDSPDNKTGWQGMSGASIALFDANQRVHLFGVVEEIPANFSNGQLSVARLASAFEDDDFVNHLTKAAGKTPKLYSWKGGATGRKEGKSRSLVGLSSPFILVRVKEKVSKGCRWYSAEFQCHITASSFRIESVFLNSKRRPFKQYFKDANSFFLEDLIKDLPTNGFVLDVMVNHDSARTLRLSFVDNIGATHGPFSLFGP